MGDAPLLLLKLPSDGLPADEGKGRDSSCPGRNLPPEELCISSFSRACVARRALKLSKAAGSPDNSTEKGILFVNCRVLDTVAGSYLEGFHSVLVRGGVIVSVSAQLEPFYPHGTVEAIPNVHVLVDCAGAVLMPGLLDAHVHCTAVTANLAAMMSMSESYVAARATHILGGMLARGFTTVRDAGGADFGLAQAVEEGVILGPKVLFTGHALSQTGGHGDFRGRGEDLCACGAALRGIGRVCDGDAEVRRAARDELRRGAHCIKIMASGGVASPTDRLTNTQFSEGELAAIVEEAAAAGTYVCAHAYTPAAVQRAVRAGVRSIEHGNYLDEQTAQLMAEKSVFLVPTLVTYQELARDGAAAGMPQELVAKVGDAVEAGLRSLALARDAGVTMCFGSDLLGDLHPAQAGEFALRSRVLPAAEVLRAATVNCAKLFGMQYTLGRVAPGFQADLLLLRPGVDPLADVAALAAPGGAAVAAVFKEGLLAKAPRAGDGGGDGGAAADGKGSHGAELGSGGGWAALNERLFPADAWPRG